MPDILVRNLDAQTLRRLKAQAKRHGRSLQAEAKEALRRAAGRSIAELLVTGEAWRDRLGEGFDDSGDAIRADRGR